LINNVDIQDYDEQLTSLIHSVRDSIYNELPQLQGRAKNDVSSNNYLFIFSNH